MPPNTWLKPLNCSLDKVQKRPRTGIRQGVLGSGTPSYYDKLLKEKNAAARVVRSMDYHLKQKKRARKRTKDLARERTFFFRNQHKMTYADFRDRGLPIGSGPVEAACKTIVKTRLGRSGMHWTWNGGQSILQLRTYVKSGRWDPFWQEYKTRRIKPKEQQDLAWAA